MSLKLSSLPNMKKKPNVISVYAFCKRDDCHNMWYTFS